jgi:hypothetical protein
MNKLQKLEILKGQLVNLSGIYATHLANGDTLLADRMFESMNVVASEIVRTAA